MFSTTFGALQRWQEDAFGQLQAGGDESFIAGAWGSMRVRCTALLCFAAPRGSGR